MVGRYGETGGWSSCFNINSSLVDELGLSGEVVHPGEGGVSGGQLDGLPGSGDSSGGGGGDDSTVGGGGSVAEGSRGDELGGSVGDSGQGSDNSDKNLHFDEWCLVCEAK